MKLIAHYNQKKINEYLLALIASTLPFKSNVSTLLIILCTINFLFSNNLTLKLKLVFKNKFALALILIYLMHIIGCFYSINSIQASAILERKFSLFLFPILLGGTLLSVNVIKRIALFFVSGVIVSLFVCTVNAIIKYQSTHDADVFLYHEFTHIFKVNAVYMAAFVVLSIHIVIFYRKEFSALVLISTLAMLVLFCLMLNSKMMFFILVVGLLISSFKLLNKKKAVVVLILIIPIIVCSFILIPKLNERISYEFTTDFKVLSLEKFNYDTHFTGTSLRLLLWKISEEILSEKNAWLSGVGVGDFQDMLNAKYKQKNLYLGNVYLENDTGYFNYNPHNQYVEILLSSGAITLIILCFAIIFYFVKALKGNNYLALQVIILFAIFFLSESVLSINKGVVSFCLFTLLFSQLQTSTNSIHNPIEN